MRIIKPGKEKWSEELVCTGVGVQGCEATLLVELDDLFSIDRRESDGDRSSSVETHTYFRCPACNLLNEPWAGKNLPAQIVGKIKKVDKAPE